MTMQLSNELSEDSKDLFFIIIVVKQIEYICKCMCVFNVQLDLSSNIWCCRIFTNIKRSVIFKLLQIVSPLLFLILKD